jgi:hypothetical protein
MSTAEDVRRPAGRRARAVPAEYFVTGPFARTDAWSTARLIGATHAKQVGTAVTVCGLSATSWRTLWEVRFVPAKLRGACPACLALVDEGRRSA